MTNEEKHEINLKLARFCYPEAQIYREDSVALRICINADWLEHIRFNPCDNIEQAFDCLEKVNCAWDESGKLPKYEPYKYYCELFYEGDKIKSYGNTRPLAICKAIIKYLEAIDE